MFKKFKQFLVLGISSTLLSMTIAHANPINHNLLPGDKEFKSLLPGELKSNSVISRRADSLYKKIHLNAYGLSRQVFHNAFRGYEYLLQKGMLNRAGVLTICDYTQSSHNKRFYVIDLKKGRVVFNTFVSHGKNSGAEYATNFSNQVNSNESSLGFMITGSPYHGIAGLSLHLKGQEKGINDHVYERSIVLHGSHYVNKDRADEGRMMGRSLGCPAVPYGLQFDIIDYIEDGSCFFIAGNSPSYLMQSRILN